MVDLKNSVFEVEKEQDELQKKLSKVRFKVNRAAKKFVVTEYSLLLQLDARLSDLKPKIKTVGSTAVTKLPVIGVILSVKEKGDITLMVSKSAASFFVQKYTGGSLV